MEETLQSKLIGRDRKISHLEDKIADMQEARVRRLDAVSWFLPATCIFFMQVSVNYDTFCILQYTIAFFLTSNSLCLTLVQLVLLYSRSQTI